MAALVDDGTPRSGAALKVLPWFKDLPAADCDRIFPSLTLRAMRRGTTLMLNRELPRCGGFVWSGAFRIVLASATGRPVALDLVRRGEIFGFFYGLERWGDALRLECRETGVLLMMRASSFAAACREAPLLAEAAFTSASKRAVDHCSRIFELATLSARERVVAELLRLARDGEWHGKSCVLRPAPTHQELAEQIGAAREVVTRALKSLQTEELISVERGQCEIADVTRLLALDERATGRRMFDASSYGATAGRVPAGDDGTSQLDP